MKLKSFNQYVNEQAGLIGVARAMPDTGQDVVGVGSHTMPTHSEDDYKVGLTSLFKKAWSTAPAKNSRTSIRIKMLHDAMNGLGTAEGPIKAVLSKLANLGELADLVKGWSEATGSNQSLLTWLLGDVSAEKVWQWLPDFKHDVDLPSSTVGGLTAS